MKIVDTHCHIEQDEFDSDREDVILQSKLAEVHLITSAITPESWKKALLIGEMHDNVDVAIGLDPMKWHKSDDAITFIELNRNQIVAVGEVGLDHYIVRDHAERDLQEDAFRNLIELAMKLKLPIQVHSRSAGKKALAVLSDMEAKDVHMHAFDGKSSLARFASREYGFYFSIPTSVVRSPQKRKLVKAIDIERLLVETDSPVLGPTKRERNVPTNVMIALREVADILNRDEEEIRKIILENTLRLYKRIT